MQLAEKSNVARATIAQIENAIGDPCLSTMVKLAEVLGVSPLLLMIREPEFMALAELVDETNLPEEILDSEQTARIELMLAAGLERYRGDSAREIAATAKKAGWSGTGAVIGAGIFPTAGARLGATLGSSLSMGKGRKRRATARKKG